MLTILSFITSSETLAVKTTPKRRSPSEASIAAEWAAAHAKRPLSANLHNPGSQCWLNASLQVLARLPQAANLADEITAAGLSYPAAVELAKFIPDFRRQMNLPEGSASDDPYLLYNPSDPTGRSSLRESLTTEFPRGAEAEPAEFIETMMGTYLAGTRFARNADLGADIHVLPLSPPEGVAHAKLSAVIEENSILPDFAPPEVLMLSFEGMTNANVIQIPLEGLIVRGRRYRLHASIDKVDESGGHYRATVLDPESGKWISYDDDDVKIQGLSPEAGLSYIREMREFGMPIVPPVREVAAKKVISGMTLMAVFVSETDEELARRLGTEFETSSLAERDADADVFQTFAW
jgi:hypothetical protein